MIYNLGNIVNNMKKIKYISVIGLGHIGLPLLVAISKSGKYEVTGFDTDQDKVTQLHNGKTSIQDQTVQDYLTDNQPEVTSNPEKLSKSDVFIICVPTPVFDDFNPDYRAIKSATKLVAKYLKKEDHLVLESTVNPGTCDEIIIPLLEKESGLKAGKDFNVAHCPERINPGDPIWNIYNIPRNIGSFDKKYNQQIANFYRSILPNVEINEVDNLKIAEATKIVENTFRDINIAYVNELAQSFDAMKVDLHKTLQAATNKPFGFMAHWPGCGVGGHCIAVDPYYLIRQAGKSGFNHRFLKLAREINNSMPQYTVNKLVSVLSDLNLPLNKTRIALLGLSYKADVADLRESPALEIERILNNLGADLEIYDPYMGRAKQDLQMVIADAKAVVVATAHKEIVHTFPKLLRNSSVKVIIDGRNCLNKNEIEALGIIYRGIGR